MNKLSCVQTQAVHDPRVCCRWNDPPGSIDQRKTTNHLKHNETHPHHPSLDRPPPRHPRQHRRPCPKRPGPERSRSDGTSEIHRTARGSSRTVPEFRRVPRSRPMPRPRARPGSAGSARAGRLERLRPARAGTASRPPRRDGSPQPERHLPEPAGAPAELGARSNPSPSFFFFFVLESRPVFEDDLHSGSKAPVMIDR